MTTPVGLDERAVPDLPRGRSGTAVLGVYQANAAMADCTFALMLSGSAT